MEPLHLREISGPGPSALTMGVRLTPHKLCHAYSRQCLDLGVDIRIIAEALGHESLE